MFNRYWREYPVFLQLILLMLMVFIMMSFSSVIIIATADKLYQVSPKAIAGLGPNSDSNLINAGRFAQMIGNLLVFLVSAVLFANFTHPKPFSYLGFHRPEKSTRFIVVLIAAIAFIPLVEQISSWMQLIDFGKTVRATQQAQTETYKAFLRMNTPSAFLQVLFIMAVVPAIGEELLFRGIIMRFAYKATRNAGLSIFISAALFSYVHGTLYNFLPILLAGILLGYIYYITGSIWFSMLFHFINNGVQIAIAYCSQHGLLPAKLESMDSLPLYVIVLSVALIAAGIWILKKQKTPLPEDWGNDFSPAEIAAKEEQQNF